MSREILSFHRSNIPAAFSLSSKTSQRPFDGELIASVRLIVPPSSAIRRPIVSVVLPTRRLAPAMKPSSAEEGGRLQDGTSRVNQSATIDRNVTTATTSKRLLRVRRFASQVSKEEYETCRITNPSPRVIAVCDKPRRTMYFTITFRPFTPQPGGLEFLPGHDYYFISTSSKDDLHRRIGGRCTSHNMKVVFKVCCGNEAETSSSSATSRNNCKCSEKKRRRRVEEYRDAVGSSSLESSPRSRVMRPRDERASFVPYRGRRRKIGRRDSRDDSPCADFSFASQRAVTEPAVFP